MLEWTGMEWTAGKASKINPQSSLLSLWVNSLIGHQLLYWPDASWICMRGLQDTQVHRKLVKMSMLAGMC